ncbi:hypothetical protein ACJJTC_005963 [Scirpophaga incertulas]
MPKDSKTAKKIRRLEKRLERYKKKENIENSDPCEVLEDPPNQVNDPDVLSFVEDNTESPSDLDPDLINNILTEGLAKEERDKIIKSQLIPINGKLMEAPRLNVELAGVLSGPSKTRDSLLFNRQQDLGLAIAGVSQVINSLSKKDFDKLSIIRQLIDTSRLLSNLHFQHTEVRRKLINPFLEKSLGENLKHNKRDSFLFSSLDEAVKSHQTMKRASNALRPRPALTGGTNSNRTSQSGPRNFQSPLRRNQYQGHPERGQRRGQYPRRQQFRPLNQDKAAAPASRGRARYP